MTWILECTTCTVDKKEYAHTHKKLCNDHAKLIKDLLRLGYKPDKLLIPTWAPIRSGIAAWLPGNCEDWCYHLFFTATPPPSTNEPGHGPGLRELSLDEVAILLAPRHSQNAYIEVQEFIT